MQHFQIFAIFAVLLVVIFICETDNEQLYALHSSLNIIRVIKPKKNGMGWACGTYGGKRRGAFRVLMGRPVERNNLEFLGMDGSIILK